MGCCRGEDVSAVEGCRWIGEPEFGLVEVAGFGFVCCEDQREETVVGTDEVLAFGFDQERATLAADAGVDDCDVDGAFGEVAPGLIEKKGSLLDGVGRDFVGDVDYGCGWGDGGDDAFEDASKMVGGAEVGEESDHRYSLE